MTKQVNETVADESSQENIEEFLVGLWRNILGDSGIERESNFFESGGDSVIALEIVVALEERFNVDIDVTDLYHNPTISELSQFIETL